MAVDPSQNLPGLLEQAEAAYREHGASAPSPTGEMRVQHAARFAAGVRLGLTDPTAVQRLHEVTDGIRDGARSILEPGAAHDRISAATAELDEIIRAVRAVRAVTLRRGQSAPAPDQAGW